MKKSKLILASVLLVSTICTITNFALQKVKAEEVGIKVHCQDFYTNIHYWNTVPSIGQTSWPGEKLLEEGNGWKYYEFPTLTSTNLIFNIGSSANQTGNLSRTTGEWWFKDNKWYKENPDNIIPSTPVENNYINVHIKTSGTMPEIIINNAQPTGKIDNKSYTPIPEANNWYRYSFGGLTSLNAKLKINGATTSDYDIIRGDWYYKDGVWTNFRPSESGQNNTSDFREETIYFIITSRFYDGNTGNNIHCWDDKKANNPDSDPAWRGDFQGLINKLDYIKALGFSAIWITPVVENGSGYDYHGYHALDFSEVDPRLESKGATYQDLLNVAHLKGMKIIQDIVLNHTSNFGEENLFPLFKKDYSKADTVDNLQKNDKYNLLPDDYDTLDGGAQYGSRISAMKDLDPNNIYHHEKSLSWEQYTEQTGQIAGDCVDLNTENPYVSRYLVDSYNKYIDMGVDGFRVDTVKHISRLTFNQEFLPAFKQRGGNGFYIFGEAATRVREVWNHNIPALSTPFYTWKETKSYPWNGRVEREQSTYQHYQDHKQLNNEPTSGNHYLNGNNYRTTDYSKASGMAMIDFPMHWNFQYANDAFKVAKGGDQYYNDATWNVTYVDSHDYAPDQAPEGQRFAQPQSSWAENLSLMFTFRGIPCVFYGSEIEFQKGKPIDVGPNAKLSETGRAYYGDNMEGQITVSDFGTYSNASGKIADTLNHPLAKHIQRLNQIRRKIPALQKGQYSTNDISSSGMAFKRRFTDNKVDSFALVTISGGASFSNIPNGTYVDAITGETRVVTNQRLDVSLSGKGNIRVFVLNTSLTSAPGKIGTSGTYIA